MEKQSKAVILSKMGEFKKMCQKGADTVVEVNISY
jgi:hypothetical protein